MSLEHDPSQNQNRHMHICPNCDSNLVAPVRWEQTTSTRSTGHWLARLRCGECGYRSSGVYNGAEIDEYDAILDDGIREIEEEVTRVEAENMQEITGIFIVALQNDLIGPDDFLPRKTSQ